MKRFVNSLLFIFVLSFMACENQGPNQNNQNAGNTGNVQPNDSIGTTDSINNSKTKYLIEEYRKIVYLSPDNVVDEDTYLPYTAIYERHKDARLLKGVETYVGDELREKAVVEYEGNTQYTQSSLGEDYSQTIIWLDEKHDKPKEIITLFNTSVYTYDAVGRLSHIGYYVENVLNNEEKYTYDGLTQYLNSERDKGMYTQYLRNDTIVYLDDSYEKVSYRRQVSVFGMPERYYISQSFYEYGPYGLIKEYGDAKHFGLNGELDEFNEWTVTYTWEDDLNCSWVEDFYKNGKLSQRREGYMKYTY